MTWLIIKFIFRYCLRLYGKSPAAYTMLRDSKLLVLPSRQRLSTEKNLIRPTTGLQKEVLQQLRDLSNNCPNQYETLALLVIDEMTIKGTV